MKTRTGFVSNSSSTSFVIIGRSGDLQIPTSLDNTLTVSGNYEFGRDFETTRDVNGRIAWAVMQAQYQGKADWLQMIADVVTETSGWTLVCPIDVDNQAYNSPNYSYIDHQSIGESNEIFASKDELKAWIFDKESYVRMGNDNV